MVFAQGVWVLFMERRLNPIVPDEIREKAVCPISARQTENMHGLSVLL